MKIACDTTFKEHKRYKVCAGSVLEDEDGMPTDTSQHVALRTAIFGIMGKEYGRTTVADGRSINSLQAWASHFNPLLYVICSLCADVYKAGFQLLAQQPVGSATDGATLQGAVKQVHGDHFQGIGAAQRGQFPGAIKIGDSRHFHAAVPSQLKSKLLQSDHDADNSHFKILMNVIWQSRTHATKLAESSSLWKHIHARQQDRQWESNNQDSACVAWHVKMKMKKEWGEVDAEEYLYTIWFSRNPAEDAKTQYRCTNAWKNSDGVLIASWWTSCVRAQPGSGSGPQCLETCNAHGWRGSFVQT